MSPRPCERECKGPCGRWKHHSRFRSWKYGGVRYGTISHIRFSDTCKDCEQIARNEKKNADRPRAIIESRARTAAGKAGVSFDFFWVEMNYRGLVPYMRAMLSDEALCLGCGHHFSGERDIQLEHLAPPRSREDWARLHTRNIGIKCGSCNGGKSNKQYEQWLDDEEERRLSNRAHPTHSKPIQMSIFDFVREE